MAARVRPRYRRTPDHYTTDRNLPPPGTTAHTPPELPSTHDQHPITYHPPRTLTPRPCNPHTPAAELARIAATRPDLHPAIAAHPHCYPALHQWIAQYQATNPAPTSNPATSPAAPGTAHP